MAVSLLAITYLFQQTDFSVFLGVGSNSKFVINKLIRFLVNDFACLMLIAAIFRNQQYVRFGFRIFLIELFLLLPLYFVLKLSWEGNSEISSPLLSQMHRMIVNPLLMIVLILGFLYQDYIYKK